MSDKFENIKHQADRVRNIDLQEILKCIESTPDNKDKAKWHTSCGTISITGFKFMNWNLGCGGVGAIDLVMHLKGFDFKPAVSWLVKNFPHTCNYAHAKKQSFSKHRFKLPQRDNNNLHQIKSYLYKKRCIPYELINTLIKSGHLYADNRGNAVFLLLGKEKKVVGAELRGTASLKWRGMALGSKKNMGCFTVKNRKSLNIVICESAIDALSFFALDSNCIAVSTSGVNANIAWLPKVINHGYKVYCGFDADEIGDFFAAKLIKKYPSLYRLRPDCKDWNEVLQMKFRYK